MPDKVKSRFIFAQGKRYNLQQQKRHGGRSMLQPVTLFICSQEAESGAVYSTCTPPFQYRTPVYGMVLSTFILLPTIYGCRI